MQRMFSVSSHINRLGRGRTHCTAPSCHQVECPTAPSHSPTEPPNFQRHPPPPLLLHMIVYPLNNVIVFALVSHTRHITEKLTPEQTHTRIQIRRIHILPTLQPTSPPPLPPDSFASKIMPPSYALSSIPHLEYI